MRSLLALIFAFQCTRCLFADQLPPLTVKEIGLMLRSGYSSETILRDLSARHFGDTINPAAEKQLIQANASPALLDALRSGDNAASEKELAQARQRIAVGKTAGQKFLEQQRMIAKEAAAQRPPNPQIVLAPMPAPQALLPLLPSEKAAANTYRNLTSAELRSLLPSERASANAARGAPIAAAHAAAKAEWCAAHPVECEQREAAARAAREEEDAHQEASDLKRKYEWAISEAQSRHRAVDTFGLPTFPQSSEARDVQREYQWKIDEANRDAKRHDDEAKKQADAERSRGSGYSYSY